ncbi:G/U mismatch-specific DNA glycosylase [Streptomyces sp. NPDC057062]|uniref:G/U mismatch-specific DNA glycosylase n=1 Tax=Streptomyces sp. NPDC057062 TaxID=3346011 RepID=UPI003636BBAA
MPQQSEPPISEAAPCEGPQLAGQGSTGTHLADILAENLVVVFVGINPSTASTAAGHSFATPGNRFWPALYASGFTPNLIRPERERDLLALGLGITALVRRATAQAAQLTPREFIDGGRQLHERLQPLAPQWVAMLGVTGYRAAFGDPRAEVGPQPRTVGGARVWILPNPSGRNAHYPPAALTAEFTRLRDATGLPSRAPGVQGTPR